MSGDIFGCHILEVGCYWDLVGQDQERYTAQGGPHSKEWSNPSMSMLLRLRTPGSKDVSESPSVSVVMWGSLDTRQVAVEQASHLQARSDPHLQTGWFANFTPVVQQVAPVYARLTKQKERKCRKTACLPASSFSPVPPTLCETMDCSPPSSSVHGIFQARIL